MAKKIVADVTLHVKDEKNSVPFKYENGIVLQGRTAVTEVKPGTPVEIEDAEADALIAQGRAKIFKEPKAVKADGAQA